LNKNFFRKRYLYLIEKTIKKFISKILKINEKDRRKKENLKLKIYLN